MSKLRPRRRSFSSMKSRSQRAYSLETLESRALMAVLGADNVLVVGAGDANDTSVLVAAPPAAPPLSITELEPAGVTGQNDTRLTAEVISGFGTGSAANPSAQILGELSNPTITSEFVPQEDDGSIPLANDTGLTAGHEIHITAAIGDGPYGATSGSPHGDFDFYKIPDLTAGQTISVSIFFLNFPMTPGVQVFDSAGNLLQNDFYGTFFLVPADGDYFVSIREATTTQQNPFDSSSGDGNIALEGAYEASIAVDKKFSEVDNYAVELQAGDILSASLSGVFTPVAIYDPQGELAVSDFGNRSYLLPTDSPLQTTDFTSVNFVAPSAGTYTIEIGYSVGPYQLNLRAFRPPFEQHGRDDHQILYLDFDGATLNPATSLGSFLDADVTTSPLAAFMADWGLTSADENAVIDAITATVRENFRDVGLTGSNGNYFTDGVDGHYGVEILTSRDTKDEHGFPLDLFGQPNVTRVIVGGTNLEIGEVGRLSMTRFNDVGNFAAEETAIVLLDGLSGQASVLNNIALAPNASKIDLIGTAVGNLATHEAGHMFGLWSTNGVRDPASVMQDFSFVGVGLDQTFGTEDDVDMDFVADDYRYPLFGKLDAVNVLSYSLATGTVDNGLQVIATDPGRFDVLTTPTSTFVVQLLDAYNPASVQASDLVVNGRPANSVTFTDATTLTFSYNTSPMTTQGPQQLNIAEGAITRASDGDGVSAYSVDFAYDRALLQVTSMKPVDGSRLELPFNKVTVQTSEPFALSSVGVDDLIVSQGRVVSFTRVNGTTITFTLDGVTQEGTFTARIPDGALTDVYGNFSRGSSVTYELDFGRVDYPAAFAAASPAGSLIYDSAQQGKLDPGDTDRFKITVDPGQTITVVVEPVAKQYQWSTAEGGNGRYYAVSGAQSDGEHAGQVAQALGGQLVSITSPAEQAFIEKSFLSGEDERRTYWIGANDAQSEGEFVWANGEPFEYTNWEFGEPNDSADGRTEDYVAINWHYSDLCFCGNYGTWNDVPGTVLASDRFSFTYSALVESAAPLSGPGLLRPRVSLLRQDNLVAQNVASIGGKSATIQTYNAPGNITNTGNARQTYEIVVAGAGNTSGAYRLRVLLNSVVEAEDYQGPENNTLATAQSLNASFLSLLPNSNEGSGSSNVSRGAVVGTTDSVAGAADVYAVQLKKGDTLTSVLTGGELSLELLDAQGNVLAEDQGPVVANGSFETGSLSGWQANYSGNYLFDWVVSPPAQTFLSPLATSPRDGNFDAWNVNSGFGPVEYQLWQDVLVPEQATIEWQDRFAWAFSSPIPESERLVSVELQDPTTGNVLQTLYSNSSGPGDVNFTGDTGWLTHTADLSAYAGQTVRIFFESTSLDPFLNGQGLYELDAVKVTSPVLTPRYTNVDRTMRDLIVPANGTYYVRVKGMANTPYELVVTRNAEFDLEGNNSLAAAQSIRSQANNGKQVVLGHLEPTTTVTTLDSAVSLTAPLTGDLYKVTMAANKTLIVETATPASGPGAFANQLDPMLLLYDSAGRLLGSNDFGGPGDGNARIEYRVPAGKQGDYYVRVAASRTTGAPTSGEYLLTVKGHQPEKGFPAASTTSNSLNVPLPLPSVTSDHTATLRSMTSRRSRLEDAVEVAETWGADWLTTRTEPSRGGTEDTEASVAATDSAWATNLAEQSVGTEADELAESSWDFAAVDAAWADFSSSTRRSLQIVS